MSGQNKNKESAAAKESGKGQGPQDAVEISAEAAQRIAEDAKLALVDNDFAIDDRIAGFDGAAE